jgi:hypothetical protein
LCFFVVTPPPSKRPAASVVPAQSKMTRGRPAAAVARTTRSGAKGASSSRAHHAGSSGASDDEAGVGAAVVAPICAGVESVGQAAFPVTSQKVGASGETYLGVKFLGSDNPELAEKRERQEEQFKVALVLGVLSNPPSLAACGRRVAVWLQVVNQRRQRGGSLEFWR